MDYLTGALHHDPYHRHARAVRYIGEVATRHFRVATSSKAIQ